MDAATLSSISLFADLDEERRARLAEVCSEMEVDAGTMLVQEGDFGYSMFAILSGTALVTREGATLRELGPGDVFGEIAVLSSGRRTATVTSTSAMRLVVAMNRDVWRLERESPAVGAALRDTIAGCLEAAEDAA
jgi:CRP-like cAMP-binding protein